MKEMIGRLSGGLILFMFLHLSDGSIRTRRGFGGGYGDIYGQRQVTFDYLNQNQNIALWSAQSAVTSSVGQVYGHQQAQLADAVRQFVTPKKTHHGQRSHYSKPSRYQAPYNIEHETPAHHSPPSHPQRSQRPSEQPNPGPWRPSRHQRKRPRRPYRQPSKE